MLIFALVLAVWTAYLAAREQTDRAIAIERQCRWALEVDYEILPVTWAERLPVIVSNRAEAATTGSSRPRKPSISTFLRALRTPPAWASKTLGVPPAAKRPPGMAAVSCPKYKSFLPEIAAS